MTTVVRQDLEPGQWSDRTLGTPDGPVTYIAEFGRKVGTFTKRRRDLDAPNMAKKPCLMHHVPHELRGHYRPEVLANYDPEREYIVDNTGMRICEGVLVKDGSECLRRAVNRSAYCEAHGGRLHPLDKVVVEQKDPATMTRWELLRHGYIDVDDLSDDELNNAVGAVGNKLTMSKELYQKIMARHFDRAQDMLREGLMPAILALRDIATNEEDIYDAADRNKAAMFIIERVMGKAPQVVAIGSADAKEPWQQLVAGLTTSSRANSRAARGLSEIPGIGAGSKKFFDEGDIQDADVVEGEVVGTPGMESQAAEGDRQRDDTANSLSGAVSEPANSQAPQPKKKRIAKIKPVEEKPKTVSGRDALDLDPRPKVVYQKTRRRTDR